MDFTTDLFRYLYQLSSSLTIDADATDDETGDATGDTRDSILAAQLVALAADLRLAVSSYLGLQLTIIENGHPVILTAIAAEQPALTFLRLPLAALGGGFDPQSRVIFYAAAPGAFVDLAADLSYALDLAMVTHGPSVAAAHSDIDSHADDVDGHARIVLDGDLPPDPPISGVSGLFELSTINRAIGFLIGQGHHPDHASDTLHRDASREGIDPHQYAGRLLRRPVHETAGPTSGGEGLWGNGHR